MGAQMAECGVRRMWWSCLERRESEEERCCRGGKSCTRLFMPREKLPSELEQIKAGL
jgi:hypothetical protein